MSDLLELAERCERTEGPDRVLDRDIEIAIQNIEGRGYDDPRDNITARKVLISHGASKPEAYEISAFSGVSLHVPREYTASLDAALTLVPEGCGRGCYFLQRARDGRGHCQVWFDAEFNRWKDGHAATPALALCAAALRARAAA